MSRKNKNVAKLKALRLGQQQPLRGAGVTRPPPSDADVDDSDDDLPAEDLQVAVETLQLLAQEPERLAHPRYKQLKRAGWDFGKVLADQGSAAGRLWWLHALVSRADFHFPPRLLGSSIHSKISHALSLSHYRQALVLLFEMHVTKVPTKLGAIQRWVRDCDATSDPERKLSAEEREERDVVLRCLDLVLRVCGNGHPVHAATALPPVPASGESGATVARMGVWDIRQTEDKARLQASEPLWQLIQQGSEGESSCAHKPSPMLTNLYT